MTTSHDWPLRVAGAILLSLGAAAAYWLPAMVAVGLLVVVLLTLAVHPSREREAADAGDTSISESELADHRLGDGLIKLPRGVA